MKFKMLLWYMARRMELLSRTHPEFIAKLHGRDFVIPDDVKAFCQPALAHRLVMDPSLWGSKKSENAVIDQVVASTRVPVI